jgi:flagellar protein FliJ
MSALKALQMAMELGERQRDDAARAVALARQQQQAAQHQQDQLEAYARETEAKWLRRAQLTAAPELMRHHYQFMVKLEQAIQFQINVIRNHVNQVEQLRQGLILVEQRLARFKHVLAARQSELAQLQARREQRQMDEMASQMALRQGRQRLREQDEMEFSP